MKQLTSLVGISFLLCFASACGDEPKETEVQDSGTPAETVDAGVEADAGGPTDAGTVEDAGTTEDAGIIEDAGITDDAGLPTDAGLPPSCASGILCGAGDCCATGEECLDGACVAGCSSGVRCGQDNATCCDVGELCVEGACVAPTLLCHDWTDCPDGQRCETVTNACVSLPTGPGLCTHAPRGGTPGDFTVEWRWTAPGPTDASPSHVQIAAAPLVVDLDGDGFPEVIVVTATQVATAGPARLRALDGRTGVEVWTAGSPSGPEPELRVTPAAADLDGDGRVEIVTGRSGGGLLAFEHDGAFKWSSMGEDGTTPFTRNLNAGAVSISDLGGDGVPEIVVGGLVFDATGKLLLDRGELFGSNGTYGAASFAAELDGAPPMELVSGRRAFHADGTVYWDNSLSDGYPAVADLDGDDVLELVVVSNGEVRIQDVTTGLVIVSHTLAATGAGGAPAIADFDGDGALEIAVASGTGISLLEYAPGQPPTLDAKWTLPIQDISSSRTPASAFDFDEDGAAELLFADECYLRVYAGVDGTELMKVPRSSATVLEYPVVADADGDGAAEIVMVANDSTPGIGAACQYGPGDNLARGVTVYGGGTAPWAKTRRIWNQHAYTVQNVREDGRVVRPERSGPIGFRQSHPGLDASAAPDLAVSLEASLEHCPSNVELRARVRNDGARGVDGGVRVRFYAGTGESRVTLGMAMTTNALAPGASEIVTWTPSVDPHEAPLTFSVAVDADAPHNQGNLLECREDNGEATLSGVDCRRAP